MTAVPNIFNEIDFLASHSYGASGIGCRDFRHPYVLSSDTITGYGFNVPMPDATIGLQYYQEELATIRRKSLAVAITETVTVLSNTKLGIYVGLRVGQPIEMDFPPVQRMTKHSGQHRHFSCGQTIRVSLR